MNIVTVVIRARDCASDLERCLKGLEQQNLPEATALEVVVVDNDSTDNTTGVARAHGARIVNIPRAMFSWGRALNYGIQEGSGQNVILLSSDACPVDGDFIANMLLPFEDRRVACVYGRQIPHPDATIEEILRLGSHFDGTPRVFDSSTRSDPTGNGLIVSNACAAIRRSIWEELKYNEYIEGGEEGIWTHLAIQRGYRSIYQPTAQVYHSHKDAVLRRACRSVELFLKNRRLKDLPISLYALVRWLLHLTKSRIKDCFAPGLQISTRLKGLFTLPLELAGNAVVYYLLKYWPQGRIRSFLWDTKLSFRTAGGTALLPDWLTVPKEANGTHSVLGEGE